MAAPSDFKQRQAILAFFGLILLVILPSALTLDTVKDPGTLEIRSDDPTPLGYTWSLSLFIVPLAGIAWWFLRHPQLGTQRKSFWTTLMILIPLGFLLDLLFGNFFFLFPNHGAVLGLEIPGVGGGLPIEEFIFYITGFLLVLLLYIWADEYWLAAYNVPDYSSEVSKLHRLVGFHAFSLWIGLAILVIAVLYKKLLSGDPEGFPWYLTYLTVASFVPSIGFFGATRPFINWRAFSMTFFIMLLISLLWEATLAAPYGWWAYEPKAMTGLFIGAWHNLPIEATLVWLAVTFTTVIIYEVVKIWQASGKTARHIFFGPPAG